MTLYPFRRTADLVIALLAVGVLALVGLAGHAPSLAADTQVAAQAPVTTKVTFRVPTCENCRIQLFRAWQGERHVWQSRGKRVHDGTVSFTIPTNRTEGMSATVRAPWEGTTGYVTQVAFRYGAQKPGSKVSLATARDKKLASGCFAGTLQDALTIGLQVRKITVAGTTGPTNGTIAWTRTTQHYLKPMLRTFEGVLGAQDVLPCHRPGASGRRG